MLATKLHKEPAVPLLINGREEFVQDCFDVVSPYTNQKCWTAAAATPRDAVRAVEAAAAAFPTWAATKPAARRDILLRAAQLFEDRLEENAEIMCTEMGADMGTSLHFVTPLAVKFLRETAARITSVCGIIPTVDQEGTSAMILKEPMGVILGIVPWNAPFPLGMRAIASALAAGNTTVLKSSDRSPRCFHVLARAFEDAGLPHGCLNVISCRAEDAQPVVNAMIEHPAVAKVNFTGSTEVGRLIAATCGQNLKPCLMELGGKNSAIVCEDANIDIAVREVLAGSFLNSGQICMSTDRVLVHEKIAPKFFDALCTALDGTSKIPLTLISTASRDRFRKMVNAAVTAGARVLYGSLDASAVDAAANGVRVSPIVLTHVTEDMAAWKNESFGPLAACRVVPDDDTAVRIANSGGYGLSAAVFTEDLRKGFRLAKLIEAGAVHINGKTVFDEPCVPHGGIKNSGWGRFNSSWGLEEFLVTKAVTWKE
ncbi:hypothetical protein HDU86_004313 [Geranomyces michiganensis]|nr:hypothetical protein HDU86_004313 [Geranomyces michiganensis]